MDQLEVEASVVASQFEHVERALTVVACLGCKTVCFATKTGFVIWFFWKICQFLAFPTSCFSRLIFGAFHN